jgi:hypothetical protein
MFIGVGDYFSVGVSLSQVLLNSGEIKLAWAKVGIKMVFATILCTSCKALAGMPRSSRKA